MIGAAEASKDRSCMAEQICASWSHSYVLSLFSADEGLAASQEGSRHLLVGGGDVISSVLTRRSNTGWATSSVYRNPYNGISCSHYFLKNIY